VRNKTNANIHSTIKAHTHRDTLTERNRQKVTHVKTAIMTKVDIRYYTFSFV